MYLLRPSWWLRSTYCWTHQSYSFFSLLQLLFYQGSISFDWPQLWAIISRHKIDVVLFVRIHGYLAEGQEAKSGQKNAEVSCFLRMVAFFKALVDIHFDVYWSSYDEQWASFATACHTKNLFENFVSFLCGIGRWYSLDQGKSKIHYLVVAKNQDIGFIVRCMLHIFLIKKIILYFGSVFCFQIRDSIPIRHCSYSIRSNNFIFFFK